MKELLMVLQMTDQIQLTIIKGMAIVEKFISLATSGQSWGSDATMCFFCNQLKENSIIGNEIKFLTFSQKLWKIQMLVV